MISKLIFQFKNLILIERSSPILEVIFVTLTENSSVVTNDTQGPQKYQHHRK